MKSKFTFTNQEKTEIRHNLVPEFLIEVIKLDAPSDYRFGDLLYMDEIFDEILIRGHHFIFKLTDDEQFEDVQDFSHLRSILKRAGKWYKSQVVAGFIPLEKDIFEDAAMEDETFILQKSDKENHWIAIHKPTAILIEFEEGKFNESNQVTEIFESIPKLMENAKIMREIGEWISKNHQNLV